jgi:hypothetical protein
LRPQPNRFARLRVISLSDPALPRTVNKFGREIGVID